MNTIVAASVLKSQGKGDWSLLALPHATPVRVRSTRCLVLLAEPWLHQATPQEVAAAVSSALRAEDTHPGYEAQCPQCGHVYTRSKPAEVVHICYTCRCPLEFQ